MTTAAITPEASSALSDEQVAERIQELAAYRYPTEPVLECDMVMASGFTSGVAYPLAACELAKQYCFRNLGGSSAGAVAASTIAAAELGRASGGFQRLATLPSETGTLLTSLFQPTRATRPIFRVFVSAVRHQHEGRRRLALAIAGSLLRVRLGAFGLGALLTLFLLIGTTPTAVTVAAVVAGGVLAAVVSFIRLACKEIPQAGFGLCPGSRGATPESGKDGAGPFGSPPRPGRRMAARRRPEPPHLTDWLASKLDDLAGLEPGQGPLTFGHLWGNNAGAPDVNLEMTTTNLTLSQPVHLPFGITDYFFCEAELAPLFPGYVLDHLTATGREEPPDTTWLCPDHKSALLPLPPPPELPVIVAARLSLSFPVLLAAAPLFTIVSAPEGQEGARPLRCLFSDGGITISFPIHLFDEPWPIRPTFGLTFADGDESTAPIEQDSTGIRRTESLSAFLSVVFQNLSSPSPGHRLHSPGYRERIARIPIQKGEGKTNLGMSPGTVDRIAVRGWQAGVHLRQTFSFDQHRWIRFLSAMSTIERNLRQMQPYYHGYRNFIADPGPAMAGNYERDELWRMSALRRTDLLFSEVLSAPDAPPFFDDLTSAPSSFERGLRGGTT